MDHGSFQQGSSDAHELDLPLAIMLGAEDGDDGIGDSAVDAHDAGGHAQGKRMKCHTCEQVMQLEGVFQKCTHPEEEQREELAKKLGIEERQVKFWFQNRRTRKKVSDERREGVVLEDENEALLAENKALKYAMQDMICFVCSSPVVVPAEETVQQRYLRFLNKRLADELQEATAVLNQIAKDADA
uniref:Homeobox domain-containing protein n=1 Tax=Oryza brachyantha TaxID=4533 RepID=J3KU65_ORYBR